MLLVLIKRTFPLILRNYWIETSTYTLLKSFLSYFNCTKKFGKILGFCSVHFCQVSSLNSSTWIKYVGQFFMYYYLKAILNMWVFSVDLKKLSVSVVFQFSSSWFQNGLNLNDPSFNNFTFCLAAS